jgi:hypothetical protein
VLPFFKRNSAHLHSLTTLLRDNIFAFGLLLSEIAPIMANVLGKDYLPLRGNLIVNGRVLRVYIYTVVHDGYVQSADTLAVANNTRPLKDKLSDIATLHYVQVDGTLESHAWQFYIILSAHVSVHISD